jgi:hypothetical protein
MCSPPFIFIVGNLVLWARIIYSIARCPVGADTGVCPCVFCREAKGSGLSGRLRELVMGRAEKLPSLAETIILSA